MRRLAFTVLLALKAKCIPAGVRSIGRMYTQAAAKGSFPEIEVKKVAFSSTSRNAQRSQGAR
jgi:hypothetical protein